MGGLEGEGLVCRVCIVGVGVYDHGRLGLGLYVNLTSNYTQPVTYHSLLLGGCATTNEDDMGM